MLTVEQCPDRGGLVCSGKDSFRIKKSNDTIIFDQIVNWRHTKTLIFQMVLQLCLQNQSIVNGKVGQNGANVHKENK